MTGEVGLGQRVLAGASSPEARALAGSLDGLQVSRENVLQVRNALKAESVRLGNLLVLHGPMLHVGECGPDPVSAPAASLFNTKIQTMAAQCTRYVQALGDAADALGQTAQSYGYNEEQIAASFKSYQDSHRTAPAPASPPVMTLSAPSPVGQILGPYLPPATTPPGDFRPLNNQPSTSFPGLNGGPR
jgi:hypothetical protein